MAAELVGRWRLSSYSARDADGSLTHPFGEHPEGALVYAPGGWMITQIAAEDRLPLGSENLFATTAEERALAFTTYLAYYGTYEVTDGVVSHRIAVCSFPNWAGTVQTRNFELNDETLLLRTPPLEIGGGPAVHELLWIREEGQDWQ